MLIKNKLNFCKAIDFRERVMFAQFDNNLLMLD